MAGADDKQRPALVTRIGGWLAALPGLLAWVVRSEALPEAEPAERPGLPQILRERLAWLAAPEELPPPPPEPEAETGPGFLRWLLAPEPLPRAGDPRDDEREPSGLRWLLARERLPAPPPAAGAPTPATFLRWLLARERLPSPGAKEPTKESRDGTP